MASLGLISVLVSALLLTGVASAQTVMPVSQAVTPAGDQQAVNQQAVNQPGLKLNAVAALRAFEPAPDQPYELGRGDEISIDFSGRPDLNAKRVVGPDGRITLPMAGTIPMADKTREQAAAAISAAFAPFYDSLTVTVGVDRYTSNRVLLLGAVQSPGIITFDRPPSLLEVLTRGGGLRYPTTSDANGVTGGVGAAGTPGLARGSAVIPPRCAIYRGTDQVLWVDLKGLLDSGNTLADLRLKRDDVIYVPSPLDRYVSILGQVSHPGAFVLDNNTTLPKLLAEAGGLTTLAGGNPKLQIIQPETGVTRVIEFKTLLESNALDLTLKSGDIIFIPESTFNKVGYILNQLSPLVTVLTVGALFTH